MSSKRKLSTDKSNDSNNNEPATKKQKSETEPTETKENENNLKVSVNIDTKLGHSNASFDASELKKISYFSNQLSPRWNNGNICTIKSNDLHFSTDEIKALIYFKTHNKINVRYPYDRLIYFCNASDFFTEKMDEKPFQNYFEEYIPAIKYQNFLHLKSLCTTNQSKKLLEAINATIQQIEVEKQQMNSKMLANWRTVPISLLKSNPDVAATVFINNFKIDKNSTIYICLNLVKVKFLNSRSMADLVELWEYIISKKIYLSHPNILTSVYAFGADGALTSYSNDFYVGIASIVLDTLSICVEDELKYKCKNNIKLINNMLKKMPTASAKNSGYKPADIKKGEIYFDYQFFVAILWQLVHLRERFKMKFPVYFGENIIIELFDKNFRNIAAVAKWRPFVNDMQKVRVNDTFSSKEKTQLLKSVLLNISAMKSVNGLQDFIKMLIEDNYEQSFKLANLWFPILMKDYKDWIIKELPQKTSLKLLRILIDGMGDYFVSKQFKEKGGDNEYLEFMNQYTNIQWSLNE